MQTANNDANNNRANLEDKIKKAVETEQHIRETVRSITLKTLSEGKLDLEEIAQVAGSVVKGAGLGAVIHGSEGKEKLARAIAGLDDALSSAAEASKLAVQEASGQVKAFTRQDLKRAIDDLNALEGIYIDTLKEAAKGTDDAIAGILNDLARHGRACGTTVGQHSAEIVRQLNQELGEKLSDTVTAGTDSALQVTSNLTYAAAGFLDAIAQTLDAKLKSKSSKNKKE
ncbi:DUF6781 family protein [Psychromonas sp.]|uniref:DUF6781 family protein n=1 Tax=Psychromonas sp. TaxID=1884585 RepID=UPI00356452A5